MLSLKAYAKVNLHLHVGARRKNGYHSIETIFQEISLHDTLAFTPTDGPIALTVTPAGLPTGSDNLVVRALEMLRAKLKTKKGMSVHLEKNIPVGAGLGGGSSDAAAALWGGWLLWTGKKKKPATVPPILLACARALGADVSFFLKGGTAWGEGVGEKLSSIAGCSRHWMVLIYPNVHVSTKEAYGLLDRFRERNHNSISDRRAPPKAQVVDYLRSIRRPQAMYPNGPYNSFQSVILAKYPEIAEARQELSRLGCAPVMMSGSGSTVFGICRDKAEAESIAAELRSRPWKTFLAHSCP